MMGPILIGSVIYVVLTLTWLGSHLESAFDNRRYALEYSKQTAICRNCMKQAQHHARMVLWTPVWPLLLVLFGTRKLYGQVKELVDLAGPLPSDPETGSMQGRLSEPSSQPSLPGHQSGDEET